MAVEIRPARAQEAASLVPAYEWLFAAPGSPPPRWDRARAAATVAALIASADAEVLVAVDDGRLVGLCTVYRDIRSVRFGQRAWVEDLAVDPGRRSSGIGRRLLDAAKRWARDHGATHLELDSSVARVYAHRFYARERPSWESRCYGWEL